VDLAEGAPAVKKVLYRGDFTGCSFGLRATSVIRGYESLLPSSLLTFVSPISIIGETFFLLSTAKDALYLLKVEVVVKPNFRGEVCEVIGVALGL
jgi:hypothetical protein